MNLYQFYKFIGLRMIMKPNISLNFEKKNIFNSYKYQLFNSVGFFPMNIWKFAISTTPHTYHTTSRRLTNSSTGRNPSSTGRGCTGNGIQPVEDNYCIRTKMAPKFSFTFIDSSYGIEEEDKENDFF